MAANQSSKKPDNLDTRVPDRIPEFVEGDMKRTPMYARVMNQIVRLLNRTANIKGANGIKVYRSDSNMVISYEPNGTTSADVNNALSQGSGSLSTTNFSCLCRYS